MPLSKQLLSWRRRHGWEPAQLADRAGVAPEAVLALEQGAGDTLAGVVIRLAHTLGVPLPILLGEDASPQDKQARLRALVLAAGSPDNDDDRAC